MPDTPPDPIRPDPATPASPQHVPQSVRDPRNLAAAAAGETDQPIARSATPRPPRPPGRPRSLLRDAAGRITRDLSFDELAAAFRRILGGAEDQLWVDVDSQDAEERRVLPDVFHFHPLAVEDALSPDSRVKVEEYTNPTSGAPYLLVVLRAVRLCHDTPDPYDTETINLTLFAGRHVLVTVHAEPAESVDAVVDLAQKNPDVLERGAPRLAHMVCDNVVDAYFPVLDALDDFASGLEERVAERFDEGALQEIFRAKRLVATLRRYLVPQRDAFNALSNRPSQVLSPDVQIYFRDVYDHVLRINDSLDAYRELLGGTLDVYLTQVSNRLGQVTKGLSVVATLSLPFVVISGMWGMNVAHVPLQQHPHGFAILVGAQLLLGVALVAVLRWRKLL